MKIVDFQGKVFLGECTFFSPGACVPYGWLRIITSVDDDYACNELRSFVGKIRRGRTDLYFHPTAIQNKEKVPGPRRRNSKRAVHYIQFPGTYFLFAVEQVGDNIQATNLFYLVPERAGKIIAKSNWRNLESR